MSDDDDEEPAKQLEVVTELDEAASLRRWPAPQSVSPPPRPLRLIKRLLGADALFWTVATALCI
ncbi:MAG: hypothetical protein Q8L48_00550 [Archangium sp.]|nr:hypothetical protein [Archangium sp.]